jgi:hypothetical protein
LQAVSHGDVSACIAGLVRNELDRQRLLAFVEERRPLGPPLSSSGSSGRTDPMKHTDAEIEEAASRFEVLPDSLAPASVTADDLSDLRAIAEAAEQVRRDEALVTECVARARARGRSWNRIAVALGISRRQTPLLKQDRLVNALRGGKTVNMYAWREARVPELLNLDFESVCQNGW